MLAAQVGIAGGTILEDGVTLWGQVGVNKTIRIGAGAVVLGQAGVTNNLEGGKTYMGFPATEASAKDANWCGSKEFLNSGKSNGLALAHYPFKLYFTLNSSATLLMVCSSGVYEKSGKAFSSLLLSK